MPEIGVGKMSRCRLILAAVIVVAVLALGVFVVVGIPLIRETETQPIVGLPTANAVSTAVSNGNDVFRTRYTQTALAKQQPAASVSQTPIASAQ